MFAFFNGVNSVMPRTRISDKLLLASCASILPVAVLLWFVTAGFSDQIGKATSELVGLQELQPLQQLGEEIVRHNRLTLARMGGASDRTEWDASTNRIDMALDRVARSSGKATWLRPLQTEWAGMRLPATLATPAGVASRHTRFLGLVRNAIQQVSDQWGLVLDPELDSYYLIDVVTARIPQLLASVNGALGIAAQLGESSSKSEAGEVTALDLEGQELAQTLIPGLRRSVEVAIRGNVQNWGSSATLKDRLPQLLAAYEDSLKRLDAELLHVGGANQASAVAALSEVATGTSGAFWREALASANSVIELRLERVRSTRLLAFSLATLAVAFAVFLVRRVSRTIAWCLGEVVSIDADVASGRLTHARERLRNPRVREMLAKARSRNGAVRDELLILLRASEDMTGTLDEIVVEVGGAGARVSESVNQIVAAVNKLEATVSAQAASTAEVSTTSTEILATARDLALTMDHVSRNVTRTADSADAGVSALQAIHSMANKLMTATEVLAANLQSISAKARDIDEVIVAIRNVANRTNLLSLNASIEAERGGGGTGAFSVVSQEILKQADQTAASALDIEALIQEMQKAVASGVAAVEVHAKEARSSSGAVDELSAGLARIIENTKEVAPQFDIVNSGMQAQAAGQISDAIAHLRDGAQQTRGAIDGFQSVAGEMRSAAEELQKAVGRLSSS
jgi:methyl-accepting chemotaxis protein